MPTPASPERKRYRGAVIGAGGIARQSHLPALRDSAALRRRVEVVALVDNAADVPPVDSIPLLERREQLRDLAPLDFIDICTPTASHLELTLWGLGQGYHVVCEKPVALTRGEADRIAAAARTSGRIVMPCHQYRHNPVWVQVKDWLASGAIGRWHLAEFSVHRTTADPGRMAQGTPWRGTSAAGRGGVLIDHGTHLVYQLLDIAGLPTSVSAWTGRLRHAAYEVEDTASLRFEYPGRLVTMFFTWAARALETQLAARPLDRARVPDEPDAVLARPCGPREEHGDQPAGIFEPHRRRVLHLVTGVAQAAGPRAHTRRHAGDVEQLIHEMRAMVEQHAAPSGRARAAPGRALNHPAGVSRSAMHRELCQMPAADGAAREPLLDLHPHRIVAVLMARHHDAPAGPGGDGDPVRLAACKRHRLLAHHVVALLEPPQSELEMGGGRRADVDEIERGQVAELFASGEQRDRAHGRHVGRAVHQRHDLDATAEGGGVAERGEVGLSRDAARPDDGTAVPPRLR